MSVLSFDCRFQYPAGFTLDWAFEISAGVTALVGPSGAGKTTVLHLVAGLRKPAMGRIVLGDKVLFDSKAGINLPPERRHVGLVFQDYQLFPHLTVQQNLEFPLIRNRVGRGELQHVVESLELGSYLHRYPATLSGGQQQRTALARALLMQPALLLLDEPFSAVDAELRASAIELVKRMLRDFPIPTLLVTHDVQDAAALTRQTLSLTRPTSPPAFA